MKANRLISTFIIVICCLLFQSGCEEQAMAPKQLSPEWFKRFEQPNQTAATSRVAKSSPKIEFEKVVHDFGNVGPEMNNLCEFKFTNTGDGILKIGEISKTCGCTPFVLAKNVYAPGESGSLIVQYHSDSQFGQTTKNLYVNSNDMDRPKIELAIKATIMTMVDYEPKTVNLLLKQDAGCPEITLASFDNQPFSINYFKSTSNCITAEFNPSVKATSFVLQPKVDLAKLEKTLRGNIEIGTSHPECKTITIALNTLPKFKISPRSIIVRGAEPKTPIVKKVRIISNYKENFELESTLSSKGIIKVISAQMVSDGYELELEITPPDVTDKTRIFTDVFSVILKGGEPLEIPCSGFYVGATSAPTASIETEDCPTCGPRIIDPATGKVSYANR